MEIADIFVINKADQAGAGRLKREIQATLELGHSTKSDWLASIVSTTAIKGEGLSELWQAIEKHSLYLQSDERLKTLRLKRASFELSSMLHEQLKRRLNQQENQLQRALLQGEVSAREAVENLLKSLSR